jgi:hypothetical protein
LVAAGGYGLSGTASGLAADGTSAAMAISRFLSSPFPFQAVAVRWHGDPEAQFRMRTSLNGFDWGDWFEVGREVVPLDNALEGRASSLVLAPNGGLHNYVQLSVVLGEPGRAANVEDLRLVFIDATGESAEIDGRTQPGSVGAAAESTEIVGAAVAKPLVVSRASWGCPDPDGTLTGSDGRPAWPKQYYSVSHIVIHHTTNSNTPQDWPAVVRAIWRYHALDLNWGDIGYNYLVDPNGTLYEGRAGGDDVVAGHTYTFNAGTMGLAFIGTFTTAKPSDASVSAAERLMAWKCDQKGFSPLDSGNLFHNCSNSNVVQQHIAGHRDFFGMVCPGYEDLNNTTCPGDGLASLLPQLRNGTAALLVAPRPELSAVSIGPPLVQVGTTLSVTLTIRNVGTDVLRSGSPDSSHVYQEGQVAAASGAGTFRIGLDYEGRPANLGAYPYRWGVGGDLAPGQSRTITCKVQINGESGPRKYWLGVVREGVGMALDHIGETSIVARVKRFSGPVGIANVSVSPATVFTQSVLMITAEVQNWGTSTPATQGPEPGYVYQEGETCPQDVAGAYRIGVDYDGRTQAKERPYRWGIGAVPPLSVRTVRGFIRMPAARPARRFWVDFVQEHVAWHQTNVGSASVVVKVPASRVRLPSVGR